MTSRISDRDHGYRVLFERLKDLGKPMSVTVGVHEDVGSAPHPNGKGATISQVAAWQEYGTARSPARSFVAAWADENEKANGALLTKITTSVLSHAMGKGGMSRPDKALTLFGEKAKGSMVRRMGDGIPPPNAPSTIARKGSSLPGIDSGEVRKAVDFKVNSKG